MKLNHNKWFIHNINMQILVHTSTIASNFQNRLSVSFIAFKVFRIKLHYHY